MCLVVNSEKLQKHVSTERRGNSSIRNVVKKLRGCSDLGFVGDSSFYFPSKILCKWHTYLELGNAFNEGAVVYMEQMQCMHDGSWCLQLITGKQGLNSPLHSHC